MNQNKLNNYDDETSFIEEYKYISKPAIILFSIILIIGIIVTIIFPREYPFLIGFFSGSVISIILLFITHSIIGKVSYVDYPKTVKRIHLIHQLIYFVTMFIFILIFPCISMVVGITLGLMLIKIASIILGFQSKKVKK